MNEAVFNTLIELYAYCHESKADSDATYPLVEKLLRRIPESEQARYLQTCEQIKSSVTPPATTSTGYYHQLAEKIFQRIGNVLTLEDRITLIIELLELCKPDNNAEWPAILAELFTKHFNFSETLSDQIKRAVMFTGKLTEPVPGAIIYTGDKSATNLNTTATLKYHKGLNGILLFTPLPENTSYLLKYIGKSSLLLDGQPLPSEKTLQFYPHSLIKGKVICPIKYIDLKACENRKTDNQSVTLCVEDIEFTYRNGRNGIKRFRTSEQSGQLIGIMGGSGVGKSTLLNLLSGKTKPHRGRILINGYDIHSERHSILGLIGFVPQDDLLFENLTVYQNIYYNAQLCFGNLNPRSIAKRVEEVLKDLDLWDIRDLKVGSPVDKVISGGQRKRLNIGLELLREPTILFVDEPTSGLSSSDSMMVMNLLKAQAIKGKLVVVNIHQPSNKLFLLLDKLWLLDKGGYPIYCGSPHDALDYFGGIVSPLPISPDDGTSPEKLLKIIEYKKIAPSGEVTPERLVKPETWYAHYKEQIQSKIETRSDKKPLPKNEFRLPNVIKQLRIFFLRNFMAKVSNLQYVLLNLIEPAVLAFVLAFFVKYSTGNGYIFAENRNLPAFIFMSVIVALFMGLSVSAEEIIGDKKILERESFLNLSRFSYINAKVIYLFLLSALQMLLFVLIGNSIIEIKGLTLEYWFVLFSAACFANLVGLIISAIMNSVVSIYITIPFILVPQILLSGTVVDFDNLNPNLTRKIYVPMVGDVMTSRWAYEALAVTQFMDNRYEKNFFHYDQAISQSNFRTGFIIPRLQQRLDECIRLSTLSDTNRLAIKRHLTLIAGELTELASVTDIPPFELMEELEQGVLSDPVIDELSGYLFFLKKTFLQEKNRYSRSRDSVYNALRKKLGNDGLIELKRRNHNITLSEWMLKKNEVTKFLETDRRIIQKYEPIFMMPHHPWGRAHFYAPYKFFNGQYVKTLWFNITIIWLYSLLLYGILQMKVLQRISTLIESMAKRHRKST